MRIKIKLALPKWDEWRKWKIAKEIKEAETCTNAIVGWKKYGKISIYIPPILIILWIK